MGTYVDSDTDFSNVVIINSYRIVIGGTWTATLVNGVTMYSNSATGESYEGPINFVGITSLTISSGANANNIVIVKGTSQTTSPTITIASGGTLSQSTIFTSTVTVASGGLSTENAYVSSKITLSAGTVNSAGSVTRTGGATDADSFYQTSTTAKTSGTLTLSDGTSTSFQTSTGTGSLDASAQGVQINDPNIYGNGASTQVNTTNLGAGSYIGDPSIAVSQPYSQLVQGTYTITNSNFVGTSSSLGTPANRTQWTAAVKNGKTVYYCSTSNTRSPYYDGPINLMNINSLTIEAGAVVDGLFATGIGLITVTIAAGGTLQNSFINSANIINSGTSSGNTFVASTYTGQSGSTSTGDYMLSLGYSNINLNLSKATSNDPIVASTLNPTSSVTLNGTASFDSYAQNAGTVPTSSKTTPTFTFTSSGQATVGCFLAGTLINTVNGLIAVEHINVGDEIIAYTDGKEEIRSVIWVGHNTVTVNTYTPKDDANYPIRILKNAISDGVPFKDLLITPEHCVVFDGQFIPARMLVNNNSIFYDTSITEYTYYHIETEQHSIITADGVLTESYLDTGNRSGFISDENIVSIVNHHKEWNVDSAAPLVTARETVEPIFIRLTQRLPELGFELCESDAVTTHESNLYLLTNTGEEIYSNHQNNGRFFFKIPADTTQIQLISRTSRPSQVIGSFVDDRRDLGVLVGKVTLVEKHTAYSIIEHFTSETLQGWDIQEPINCRWTNGNGALNIRSEPSNNVAILVIEVLNAGPYLLTENSLEQKVA